MDASTALSARALRCLALLGAGLVLSGQALAQLGNGVTYFLANARYAEMEKAAETEYAKRSPPGAWPIAPLCFAHWKVKRYAKLFKCVDELEARIKAGDKMMNHEDAFLMAPSDVSALPQLLRANAWLELGDNLRAFDEAKRGLAAIPDSSSLSFLSPIAYKLEILPVAAIASYLLNDQVAADTYFQELKDLDIGYFGSGLLRNLREYQLARINMIRGDYVKTLEHAREDHLRMQLALANLFTSRDRNDSLTTAFDLGKQFMIGKSLLETGKRDEARQVLDQLLGNPRLADQGDIHWPVLYERGRVAEAEGDLAGATEFFRRAVELIDSQRASINTEASKIGFVGNKQQVYARLITLLVQQGRTADAFDIVERSKSRALVDMLASKKDFAAAGANTEKVMQVLAQLDAANIAAKVDDAVARPAEKAGEGSGQRNLKVAREEIRVTAPELATLVSVSSVPVDELKGRVGESETLVEYYYDGKEMIAFVLSRNGLTVTRLDGAGVDAKVQALRSALEITGTKAWQAPSRELYDRLWKPLEASVTTRNVIIVAHGALHYLPFSALQAADGSLLIDKLSLRLLPSASVLKFLRPPSAKRDARLLVLGNPDLGDAKLDLKFAEIEARQVAGMNKAARLLVRREASESNFKKSAGVFSQLHFATHGKFQADDPLSSGLYLAKDVDNDGVLTVGELYSMNLDADLVTLSACETGLGKVANGDDVVGLTRGFLYAGSRSIVASLWSVDDQATAILMQTFYENLATRTRQEALRQAQLKARETYPHPYYWAAFQLTGRAE